MKKSLILICAAALLLAVAGTAQAGTFVPEESFGYSHGGGQPGTYTYAQPGTEGMVHLTDNGMGGHNLSLENSVMDTVNHGAGTAIYTGIPLITSIRNTYVNVQPTTPLQSGFTHTNFRGDGSVIGPYMGGVAPLKGQQVVYAFGDPIMVVDLEIVGGTPGIQFFGTMLGFPVTVTGGPWVTGSVTITGITSNVITLNGVTGVGFTLHPQGANVGVLSQGGGFVTTNGGLPIEVHTVTAIGTNNLMSASGSGVITIISPTRVNTSPSIVGRYPSWVSATYTFVPEPGTLLLLVSGAVGLMAVGRRRLRNK